MNMKQAAALLRAQFSSASFSPVYKTKPMEEENQEDFLNAACRIETEKAPEEVLHALQDIESILKKNPPYRYGPRTIDLDLLLYDELIMRDAHLAIPHDRMQERRFVLEPMLALMDANTRHPAFSLTWNELLKKTMNQRCERIDLIL